MLLARALRAASAADGADMGALAAALPLIGGGETKFQPVFVGDVAEAIARAVDGDAKAGGMIRTQIPKFRLPDSVIDEETGYILDLGVELRGGTRVNSLKALLAEGWDAVFIGSGAPRGRRGRRDSRSHA